MELNAPLKERFELVKSIYQGWCSLSSRAHCRREKEIAESILAEHIGMDFGEPFIDAKDLSKRVRAWLRKSERQLKRRFEKKLREACLSRCKRKKKSK